MDDSRSREYIEKAAALGPGRGWWGPPIGTHGPGSQGGKVDESDGGGVFRDEERKLANLGFEVVNVYERDGTKLYSYGSPSQPMQVQMTTQQTYGMEGKIILHNHPTVHSGGFSEEDVRAACQGRVAEFRVVTGDNKVYTLKPGASGWDYGTYYDKIRPMYQARRTAKEPQVRADLSAKKITQQQAQLALHHELWREIAGELGLGYSVRDIS